MTAKHWLGVLAHENNASDLLAMIFPFSLTSLVCHPRKSLLKDEYPRRKAFMDQGSFDDKVLMVYKRGNRRGKARNFRIFYRVRILNIVMPR